MGEINCYIPIKLSITGRLSDTQLEQLGEALTRTLKERLAFAERVLARGSLGATSPKSELIQEQVESDRLDPLGITYEVPFYQDGKGEKQPLPIANALSQRGSEGQESLVLRYYSDLWEVFADLKKFFPNPTPQGQIFFGVYGYWVESQRPYIFYVTGFVEAGTPQARPRFSMIEYVSGKIENGNFVSSSSAAGLEMGASYRLKALPKPQSYQGANYEAIILKEPDGQARPAFLAASVLQGRVIRFGIPREIVEEIEVTAPRLPPLTPNWQIWWGSDSLPAEPEAGISQRLWWWYSWFNVRPATMRAHPTVRAIFTNWESSGARADFNPLWMNVYYGKFYQAFCQQVSLQMLATSRQHMNDWLAQFNSDRSLWQQKFNNLLQALRPEAQRWQNSRQMVTNTTNQREILSQELGARERAYQDQQREGPLPAGVVGIEDLEGLRSNISTAQTQIETAQAEINGLVAIFERASHLNPLLTLLTIRNGQTIASLDRAILNFNTGEDVVSYMATQLQWLIGKTTEAEQTIGNDEDIAYKLQIVQEAANEQLAPWLESHLPFQEAVQKLIGGGGFIEWLGLAGALLILTFLCPPVGLAVSLGVSVATAVHSVIRAVQLSDLSEVRIAQQGFRPFAADTEVSAAIIQAVLDVAFALFEAGMLARTATQALRRAARLKAVGEIGKSLESVAAGWSRLESWPEGLTKSIRQRVLEHAGEGNIDELVSAVKQGMLRRYENRLLRLQQDFDKLLETNPSLSDLQTWITKEFPPPQQFFEQLAERELRSGEQLFEETVGEWLAHQRLDPETVNRWIDELVGDLEPRGTQSLTELKPAPPSIPQASSFREALDRVDLSDLSMAERAQLQAGWQRYRQRPNPRLRSEDEYIRFVYGKRTNRLPKVESAPRPLGATGAIEQEAGHLLERVINNGLPAGSANSRNIPTRFGNVRPDHLPPGQNSVRLDSIGRRTSSPKGTPFSAQFVGDSKYKNLIPTTDQTRGFVMLARLSDERRLVFYVRWQGRFPAASSLAVDPQGIGYVLPNQWVTDMVGAGIRDLAHTNGVRIQLVSNPLWL